MRQGGGSGGHNGIKSIDEHVGRDYWRVRMGIGHPGDKDLVSSYVLSDFTKADAIWLQDLLDAVADNSALLLQGKDGLFMTKIAQAVPPEKEEKKEKENGI